MRLVVGWACLSGVLSVIGCGSGKGAKTPDGSAGTDADAAGAPIDCGAVCERVRDLCAGNAAIDDVWVSVCQSQCQARVQLTPDVAALESLCVGAASTCDTAVSCVATPTAPPAGDGGANLPDGGGSDVRDAAPEPVDARTSSDAGPGASVVRATVDGTPFVFDRVTNVQFISDVILVEAWTSDQTRSITTYTASGTGMLPALPATYGCTSSDIGYLHYTVYGPGGPDAGAGQTYGNTSSGSSPCKVIYTRADFTRIQGTFSATAFGPNGSAMITNGAIDVAVR